VDRLSEALSHIQFQDVMRQRLEHVQSALVEMRDHLMGLGAASEKPGWDGIFETNFKDMLASQLGRYRMASQTANQPLQLVVLFPKLAQFTQLTQAEACILLLPQIKALLTDAMLAAHLDHRLARFRFPKNAQNLLFAVTSLAHLQVLLYFFSEPRQTRISQLQCGLVFGFWVTPNLGVSYGGRIAILPGQSEAEEFSTLVHEVAHLCCVRSYVA
jgi:hypothetical protein